MSPSAVAAKTVKYRGIHPLPPHTGDFCYIDFFHVHAQPPSDMRGYRVLPNQEYLFVGDEVALGYQGSKHAYFGPHLLGPHLVTVPATGSPPPPVPVYCYLRGPHFHATAPAAGGPFLEKDGVAWFTGTFGPEFDRERFNVWVNDIRPIAGYRPPQVDLAAAPPGYKLPATVEAPVIRAPAAVTPPAPQKGGHAAGGPSQPRKAGPQGPAGGKVPSGSSASGEGSP